MSNINLGLTTSHTQSDSKETAASTKKINTWSTPFIYSNDCMKKIMEFCNIHQIFRLAGVNRHCNHIASTTYSNLSFHLSTLHSNFTDLGSVVSQLESAEDENSRVLNENLKSDIISSNGDVKFLTHDTRPTLGVYHDIIIKKGKDTLEVINKTDGECLIDLVPLYGNKEKIISAFRITQKEYISISSGGDIDFYNIKNLTKSSLPLRVRVSKSSSLGTSVKKVFLIEDKIYLLCKKFVIGTCFIMSYNNREKNFSVCCKHSSKGYSVVNCIANKTHLFVIFQNAIACYDKQSNLVWEIEERYSNEQSLLEINDKFLLITSDSEFNSDHYSKKINVRVLDIIKIKCMHLKTIEGLLKENFNLWGDYVISVNDYKNCAYIGLWNPNDGQLIISIKKQFDFCNKELLILNGKNGLIGFSQTEIPVGQLSKEQILNTKYSSIFKIKFIKYTFYLLKASQS